MSLIWPGQNGEPVSCTEKLRLLEENWQELSTVMRDTYDDAVLMGVDPARMQDMLTGLVRDLSRTTHTAS
ncbi:hypothetical protein LOC54_06885 [Acetobacter sp. AN02]|uniref:hypothetical protein n=1 Tax=Acetobacter sp. AN02 TaxID=2894186 RepID=UPI00243420FB|nr:hypothetical protein [Acetobacter sp. AN02]MDG6094836.1 hypothetical protein [Acetobacter sp. AN02]